MEGLNDWQVAQWLPSVPFPYTEADARAFIAHSARVTPPDAFAVMHRVEGQFLGGLGLTRTGDVAELGYWLLPRFHGRGLMAEAVASALRHQVGSLATIFATVDRSNTASIKLLDRSGLRLTGEHVRETPNRQGNIVVLCYQKDLWQSAAESWTVLRTSPNQGFCDSLCPMAEGSGDVWPAWLFRL